MKWAIIYLVIAYLVSCADDTGDSTFERRVVRAFFWPLTINSWFRSQSIRLHRLLNILWTTLIMGWIVTLLMDRIHV